MERFPLTNTFEDAQHSIDCAPDGVAPAGVCQGRYEIVCAADTIDQMRLALRAHESECSRCGCTRKTVASDRLYLNPAAVCCGEVA